METIAKTTLVEPALPSQGFTRSRINGNLSASGAAKVEGCRKASPEVELMETVVRLSDDFLVFCRKASPEVELMETWLGVDAGRYCWCRKASPEVELMETECPCFGAQSAPSRKASPEVELMETHSLRLNL